MVKDKADNTNNRFGVGSELNRRLTGGPFPFWGCPPKDALTTLQPKRTREHGPDDLPEFRHADVAAKGAASIWKLYYNGSVGGQAIVGIPAARRLKDARGDAARVWPFETGFKALTEADLEGVQVVIAEVYPSLVKAGPAPARSRTPPRCGRWPSTSPSWTKRASWRRCSAPKASDEVIEAARPKKAGSWGLSARKMLPL
jgi:hypothetical protein